MNGKKMKINVVFVVEGYTSKMAYNVLQIGDSWLFSSQFCQCAVSGCGGLIK